MRREEMVRNLHERREPWEIVVIGGGATGMGVAVDAASRGLSVALIEAHDFGRAPAAARPSWCMAGCATSSRATFRW